MHLAQSPSIALPIEPMQMPIGSASSSAFDIFHSLIICTAHILFFSLVTLFVVPAHATERVALVIGNAAYPNAPLKNPENDAQDIGAKLEKYGFKVSTVLNADLRIMEESVEAFYRSLRQATVGLFYYAGHGMQIDGHNYLIPVDARLTSASDVRYRAFNAGHLLGKMEDAGKALNIVILDACRDNPFRSFIRSGQQGLAFMDAPTGTIIAYSTGLHDVAADGQGRNGLYTEHLLKKMDNPDLTVLQLFNETALAVRKTTNDRQQPFIYFNGLEPIRLAGGNPDDLMDEVRPNLQPEPENGSIMVTSKPEGAIISLGGKTVGNTPLLLDNLSSGTVRIATLLKGYSPKEQKIEVHTGRQAAAHFDLEQEVSDGLLTVATTPANAKVRILNIRPVYSPGMVLPAGRYHIEVSAPGYSTQKRWLEMTTGDDLTVTFNLHLEEDRSVVPFSGSDKGKLKFTDPITGMEFLMVPGGCFIMGDVWGVGKASEKPVHEVCVDSFYMGKFEVTQEEYSKIMEVNPAKFQKGANYPVERVNWYDAQKFITQLNWRSGKKYRLPTEAEWEYAARSGGRKEKFSGGEAIKELAWYGGLDGEETRPVGSKRANGLGLYDMSGNVWEWCQDWYALSYYQHSPKNNPKGPSNGKTRVYRGGSVLSELDSVRTTVRNSHVPDIRHSLLGFRVVLPVQ